MKHFLKNKGKRLTAVVLSAVMCLAALPMSAFTAEEGKTVDAYYGDKYVGADGEKYYNIANYQFIAYDSNGNTSLHTAGSSHARTKLMIKDSSGSRQIMCIEPGIDYNAGGTYDSKSGKNSSYFQNLPMTAQYGIMLTSVYGWKPGKTAPISGTNEDDFSLATQTLLWEYQQQLRTSPTTLQANSYGIPGDTYYQSIKGRPAEKCYNWILSQMKTHSTVPSFASNQAGNAQTYTLKYNQVQDNYSLTLTDTNNLLTDIHFTSDKGITVTRSGNNYTFTSKKMIENAVRVTAQKDVPGIEGNFLIWGYPGKQTMMSGAEDPVYFYMNIKTETTGIGHIVKHSEDGKVDGIRFTVSGNGLNKTVTTKADGTVDIELMPGVYTVTEESIEKYEPQKVQRVTIVSGGTSAVTFSNTLKRGDVQVIKSSEDNFVEGVKAPEYLKTRYKKLLMEYQKVWKTKEKNKAFSALVALLLNCEDIFRMFEDKLPPVVKKKADINKEYRQKCDEWCDLVYDNLDIYADFVDKKTKDTAFISILLHKIATEKKNTRYKLVLYCVG